MTKDPVIASIKTSDTVEPWPWQRKAYSLTLDPQGTKTSVIGWEALRRIQGPPVLFIPSLGEHALSYQALTTSLANLGFQAYCYDHRGHSSQNASYAHIDKFDMLVRDLLQVCNWISYINGRKKPIVIAQGLGATIAVAMSYKYRDYVEGTVLSAPSVIDLNSISSFRRGVIHLLADIQPTGTIPQWLIPKEISGRETITGMQGTMNISFRYIYETMKELKRFPIKLLKLKTRNLILLPENFSFGDIPLQRLLGKSNLNVRYLKHPGRNLMTSNLASMNQFLSLFLNWYQTEFQAAPAPSTAPLADDLRLELEPILNPFDSASQSALKLGMWS